MKTFKDNVALLDGSFNVIEIVTIVTKSGETALRKACEIYKARLDVIYIRWA